jgi:hypothetical protein
MGLMAYPQHVDVRVLFIQKILKKEIISISHRVVHILKRKTYTLLNCWREIARADINNHTFIELIYGLFEQNISQSNSDYSLIFTMV